MGKRICLLILCMFLFITSACAVYALPKEDLQADSAFWLQYDGKAAEVSQTVNNTYLKLNSQDDGVKSYGRMVDLLLAYRREEHQDEKNRVDGY